MPLPLTKLGRDVFAPVTAGGSLRGADLGDAVVLTTEYEALLKALIAGSGGITLLPDIINAVNSGAGTADAIKATASGEMATSAYSQLVTVNFTAANTGPMTISINDETPRPLVTNTGQTLPAGYVSAGMSAIVQIDGAGNYRLFSYGDASAIQAVVEALLVSATAEADRAETAAGGVASAPQWAFASTAALALFSPAAAPSFLEIAGARYELVASEPSHPGKAQDGAGNWYEFAAERVSFADLGALPSLGNVDAASADAIAVAAALSLPLYVPAGSYQFLKQVDFSPLLDSVSKIALGGDVYLDFSGATDPLQFPDHCFVKMDAGPLTQFAELAVTANELSRKFTLQTPSLSPQPRDVLTLWNPDNGSWNGVKSYYRAGEFVRVARYDGGTKDVTIAGGLLDTYAAGSIYIYKHPAKKITITGGRLFIRESANAGFEDFNSFMATRMADSDFSAIVPLNPAHSGHLYNQCLGLHGYGYHIDQYRSVGSDNYGLVFANCQDCDINGYFSALKHGATAGGTDEIGSIVNSNIRVNGTLVGLGPASPGSGIVAANFHGNVRNSRVGGYIGGGVSMGGDKNGLTPGTILTAREDGLGIAILLTEMVGHDFDFSGTYIRAAGDPGASAQATIAIGADTDGATNFTKHGGKINLDGCIIDAPQSTRPMTYQNRGYVGAEKVTISMKGATLGEVDDGVDSLIVVTAASGRNIDRLELDGFSNLADASYSVAGVDAVSGWRAGGTVGVNPAIGEADATTAVSFKSPGTPSVMVTPQALAAGGKPIKPYYANPTNSGADVGYSSVDNTAFTTTDGALVSWQAFLDE